MTPSAPGAPPLAPFGLILHHDGRFTHEGLAITNPRVRRLFERSVGYLVQEGKYVVQVGPFRGELEVEEAGFFVRMLDAPSSVMVLSDGTRERLEPSTLRRSRWGDALLCTVKGDLLAGGLPARFTRSAQAELLLAVAESADGLVVRLAGRDWPLPAL